MTARMQVLYLPSMSDGDRHEPRYAFVVDQAGDLCEDDREALTAFATSAGGQGCVVLSGALDLVQGEDDDEEATAALTGVLREAMTGPAFEQPPAVPQPRKLPPPDTVEGKYARIMGGQKLLDEMKEDDPR